jgi:Fe-S cluster assembly protein SufD
MSPQSEPVQRYLDLFSQFSADQGRDADLPLSRLRASAMARFSERGFPTQKDEDWKYTNTNPIIRTPFILASQTEPESFDKKIFDAQYSVLSCSARLVFIDGKLSPGASFVADTAGGLIIESLAEAFRDHGDLVLAHLDMRSRETRNAFGDLNTAFLSEGAFVFVPQNMAPPDPIHLMFISSGKESPLYLHPRALVVLENGAAASIVETHVSAEAGVVFSNAMTELFVGENASAVHYGIHQLNDASYHVGNLHVVQSRNSRCETHSFALGGALVRNDAHFILDGEGCEATLNGLALTHGSQLADAHTTIDHAKPNCASHEQYKYIVNGKSRGVFNGKIIVRKDAQKTDARQSNNNLILSNEASVNTRPQLEILANDVKCTHGATIGRLDEEALFYLTSRGIGRTDARNLLVGAFAGEIVNRVSFAPLQEYLQGHILTRVRNGST